MAEEVKLLGTWASPFSRRIELALKLKGVEYEYVEVDLYNKSTLLLKHNPIYQQIPVFIHNGKSIAESLVILEYIDETWKQNPILPKDPYKRAIARFWAKYADEKILQTVLKFLTAPEEEYGKIFEEIGEQFKVLENELEKGQNFGVEAIGYVDIVAFTITYWFQVMVEAMQGEFMTKEGFPVLCKWVKKLLEVDVVKGCVPPREKHVAYVKARRAALKSASK